MNLACQEAKTVIESTHNNLMFSATGPCQALKVPKNTRNRAGKILTMVSIDYVNQVIQLQDKAADKRQ